MSLDVGQLDFEDDRRWWWDEELDAVRLGYELGDFEVDARPRPRALRRPLRRGGSIPITRACCAGSARPPGTGGRATRSIGLELGALAGKEFVLGRTQRIAVQSSSLDTTDHRLARAGVVVDHAPGQIGWCAAAATDRARSPTVRVTHPPSCSRASSESPTVRRWCRSCACRRSGRSRDVWAAPTDGEPANGPHDVVGRLVDEDVSVLDGRRIVFRQRYIVIEGEPLLVEHVQQRLAAIGMRDRLVDSLDNHLALGPPDPVPWPLEDPPTAAAIIQRSLARSVARLLAHDPVVRLDLHVEGVHRIRVASRRLRSDLRTFRAFLGELDVLDDLRWLASLLGEVRDPDVLRERLESAVAHLDAPEQEIGASFVRRLVHEHDAALVRLHKALDTARYLHARGPARRTRAAPAVGRRRTSTGPRSRWSPTRARRGVACARRHGAREGIGRHDRRRARDAHPRKRFRYTIDALGEVEPGACPRRASCGPAGRARRPERCRQRGGVAAPCRREGTRPGVHVRARTTRDVAARLVERLGGVGRHLAPRTPPQATCLARPLTPRENGVRPHVVTLSSHFGQLCVTRGR